MIRLVNDWGNGGKRQNNLIFKKKSNEDFSKRIEDVNLVTDNAIESPSSPFSDVAAEMPGVQLEREQPIAPIEEPRLPSEEDEVTASVEYANFGTQDKIDAGRDASTTRPRSNIVCNINFDVVNDQTSPDQVQDQYQGVLEQN